MQEAYFTVEKHLNRRRFLELSAGAAVAVTGLSTIPAFAKANVTTSIAVNGADTGRTFDGIGAISGGGGNSRLLYRLSRTQQARSSTISSNPMLVPICTF